MQQFYILAILFFLLTIGGCSVFQSKVDSEYVNQSVYPDGSACNHLHQANWKNQNLMSLTYGCLPAGWQDFFDKKNVRSEMRKISDVLQQKIKNNYAIEPGISNTFRALYKLSPDRIRVVILGQDPAPQRGMATGLAFSTPPGVSSARVASIQRVLLEAMNEGYCANLQNGDLEKWANNGVLLLNMALTIQCEQDSNYCQIASDVPLWAQFTKLLIQHINIKSESSVFILWGSKAGEYAQYITGPSHQVIRGGHPSPAGAPHGKRFFCGNYFRCSNQWLQAHKRKPVDWNLIKQCQRLQQSAYWTWDKTQRKSNYYQACKPVACPY